MVEGWLKYRPENLARQMRRFTLENVMPYGVDSRLKLDRLSSELKCPRNRRNDHSRRLVAVELEVDLDPALRVGVRRLERLKPSRARRDADLREEWRGRLDAREPRLHKPDRMRAPGVAVASRFVLPVLSGVGRFLCRRKALLDVVAPEVEALEEEVAAPELEVRLEKIVREVDCAALEVLVFDEMPEPVSALSFGKTSPRSASAWACSEKLTLAGVSARIPRFSSQNALTIARLSFSDFSSQYFACSSLPRARSVSAAERIARFQ